MRNVWLVGTFVVLNYAVASVALPKYERTTLPFPESVSPEDKNGVIEVLKLQVHQDSEKENIYYYMPPMHIRQYTRGAASMFLFSEKIKIYSEIKRLMQKRNDYNDTHLTLLRSEAEKKHQSLIAIEDKILDAQDAGDVEYLAKLEKILERRSKEYDKATYSLVEAEEHVKKGESLMPAAMLRDINELALFALSQASLNVPYTGKEDPQMIFDSIKDKTGKLASSYGGYLSVNAYAGFTKEQLDTLKNYKTKYFPEVRVVLLPVEELKFFPLTDTTKDNEGSAIFTEIKGAGDYLGSTIVLNASILGAMGFATHLAPNVLPIGIKATLKQELLPFEAELNCDYTTGYSVHGRADVKDGLIIFDNDITNGINAEDKSKGGCKIKLIKGDFNSAQFVAMQNLEKTLTDLQITRTHLAKEAKDQYYRSVMNDIKENRRPERKSFFGRLLSVFTDFGWEGILIETLSNGSDFHWHTNIQNMQNTSALKFNKKVEIEGHSTVTRDMPTNLCIVWNVAIGAYDRCTTAEEAPAQGTLQVAEQIFASPLCVGSSDPAKCAEARENAGLLPNRVPQSQNDDSVPGEF